ncbi:MAG: nuclear transport factor 2 family protein [Bacteroidota bacterium]
MDPKEQIQAFYQAFHARKAEEMVSHYHKDIVFSDPGFGTLKGEEAGNMWRMLISQMKPDSTIEVSNIQVDGNRATADWVATYKFGPKNRQVVNRIQATFLLEEGKIIKHDDVFSFWKWSSQALGLPGMLLGWTSFLQKKVQATTTKRLAVFSAKRGIS